MPEDDQSKWVGIRPTNPGENIPVTESAPLTDILVAPSAGNPQFETVTQKRAPAIADIQAIESFVRVEAWVNNVGAPNYNHDLYTVPAGKIFRLEFLMGMCSQADPTYIAFSLRSGATDYMFYTMAYGIAWEQHRWTTPIMYNEAEIVRITWSGTLAGTDVYGIGFGYLIDKY